MEKQKEEIKVIRDQLTIWRQEWRTLGKRNAPVEPREARALEEAVAREIKRRRKDNKDPAVPVTLQERRAADKAQIANLINENAIFLANWHGILA